MQKLIIVIVFVWVCSVPATAGDRPKEETSRCEFFAGYQYTHYPAANANGWNAAIAGNFNRWAGLEADFSGVYNVHDYTYLFGSVFSARTEHVKPFVHALFGGAWFVRSNAFCMALGGGLDARINERLAFRLFQADWLSFSQNGYTFRRNGRLSAGVVFKF